MAMPPGVRGVTAGPYSATPTATFSKSAKAR